jgi:hypothetical protein
MYVMTVFARYLSSSDNLAPAAGRTANKSAENPAKVIIRPANVYKKPAPLNSMSCSTQEHQIILARPSGAHDALTLVSSLPQRVI